MKRIAIVCAFVLCFALGALLSGRSYLSVSSGNDSAAPQVLIDEMHALRLALQDFAVTNHRTQTTIERLKYHQSRLDRLAEQKDAVQSQADEYAENIRQCEEQLRSLQSQVNSETEPTRHAQLESEQRLAASTL